MRRKKINFFNSSSFRRYHHIRKNLPLIKNSSGDLTHLELIENAALTKKPLILSTGLGTKVKLKVL